LDVPVHVAVHVKVHVDDDAHDNELVESARDLKAKMKR
jgi:hypothetical protein